MDMVFCRGCEKQIHQSAPTCPGCGAPQTDAQPATDKHKSKRPIHYYLDTVKRYGVFSGRSRRKEYWYFVLLNTCFSISLNKIGAWMGMGATLAAIYSVAMILPSLGVGIRRLHDTGRSGWWILLIVVNLIFLAQDGDSGTNKYGDDPKLG